MKNSGGHCLENNSGELQVVCLKRRTLVVSGLLLNNYSSWLQMENSVGFGTVNDIGELQMENYRIRL